MGCPWEKKSVRRRVQKRIRIQPNSGKFKADEQNCIASNLLPGRTPQPGWCFDALGGLREDGGRSVDEQKGLVLLGHIGVHDWGVLVPLDVGVQTLNITPANGQGLLALPAETFKSFKGLFDLRSCLWGCHVHEG